MNVHQFFNIVNFVDSILLNLRFSDNHFFIRSKFICVLKSRTYSSLQDTLLKRYSWAQAISKND